MFCVSGAEPLAAVLLLPRYTARIACVPTPSPEVLNTAFPALMVADPMAVILSRKRTVPDVSAEPLSDLTVAVKVTFAPDRAEPAEETRVVVVATGSPVGTLIAR